MARNNNPFTVRQIRFIEAIRQTLTEISDPDSPFISEDYEWRCLVTNYFGKIPKLHFKPFSSQTKAEIIAKAGLSNPDREKATDQIRAKYGFKKGQYTQARLFESEWNNLMHKTLRAVKTIAYINAMFASEGQTISEPIKMMYDIALADLPINSIKKPIANKTAKTPENRNLKPYNQILAKQ